MLPDHCGAGREEGARNHIAVRGRDLVSLVCLVHLVSLVYLVGLGTKQTR
jgi:hypothetical protein